MDLIDGLLGKIYGENEAAWARELVAPLIESFAPLEKRRGELFDQRDVFLITYGDSLKKSGERPLRTLRDFAVRRFKGVFDTIHILPFFPYSSDDGFSVMDFAAVNPELGDWPDIRAFGEDFGLMFDLVINHVSAKSDWFAKYLAQEEGFDELAIEVGPGVDLSMVVRPRTLPLLTEFTKKSGEKVRLWTTFSADQIDLNYRSPQVLEKMLAVLLLYLSQGATALRLDAIAYLWKEIGTSCIHLEQTRDVVRLIRTVVDRLAPGTVVITETNVPHEENVGYFGNGRDQAQMVYNFTLPPLLLYSIHKGDAKKLSDWAEGLSTPSDQCAFFNFTASHDGIGVRPLEGIVADEEIACLAEIVLKNGGRVSSKSNPDGSQSPYEFNIVYLDALRDPAASDGSTDIARFLVSQAVQYALPGVPATYIHSVLGSRNWGEGVEKTGMARSINREKLDADAVEKQLSDPDSFRSRVFYPYLEMIRIRRSQPAFHPNATFRVLRGDPRVFACERRCEEQTLFALANLSPQNVAVDLSGEMGGETLYDLFSEEDANVRDLELKPYQYLWLSRREDCP